MWWPAFLGRRLGGSWTRTCGGWQRLGAQGGQPRGATQGRGRRGTECGGGRGCAFVCAELVIGCQQLLKQLAAGWRDATQTKLLPCMG